MRKTDAFRRAAALLAALSITVSLAAPAFAGTYYIDEGDITIIKNDDGSQTIQQQGKADQRDEEGEETIITTREQTISTLESDLEGPAAEDTGFGPVVEDNYQPAPPAQPEDAEEPKDDDQPEDDDQKKSTEESEDANRQENAEESEDTDRQKSAEEQESAGQQPQPQQAAPAAAPAAPTSVNGKGNGVFGNTITVINNFADKVLKLTLRDVKIDVSGTVSGKDGKAALSVQGVGNVEIELDGKNELKSGYNRAGLEKTSTGALTLKDDNKEADSGSLKATGGYSGAGIGGGRNGSGKNITINGGTVNAAGGFEGAGIGGGNGGSGEDITIKGGRVTATGGELGAGIGGGWKGSGECITIKDGTVNAAGGTAGAGIGGGQEGSGKNITINRGTVNATGGNGGSGIGGGFRGTNGGNQGNGENITITGGVVNAAGGTAGAGIGGGAAGNGSNITVSGAAQVTTTAGKSGNGYGAGATIGSGGNETGGQPVDGDELQADISGLTTTGYIRHMIYNEDGSVKQEWREFGHLQPAPDTPNAPAEESNEVDLGIPWLYVETLEGSPLPFNARRQGSTLRVTTDNLSARLYGTRQALEALREQGVEQIQFVTSFKTTTLPVADLLAEGGSWFALEHDGLVSRRLSAAQAESLKCRMH